VPVSVFESLAERVWWRIMDGENLGVRQGEETLTDHVLLELKRANPSSVVVWKTPKKLESKTGTDWEWWIGSNTIGWIRYAVQAKKVRDHKYKHIAHSIGKPPNKRRQIDVLDQYARTVNAVPLYCLFNHVDHSAAQAGWRCSLSFDPPQLGCTVTPSSVVRTAINTPGKRTFEFIHSDPKTLPWRCLVRCPAIRQVYRAPQIGKAHFGVKPVIWRNHPVFAQSNKQGQIVEMPSEFYPDSAVPFAPRHVVIVDIGD